MITDSEVVKTEKEIFQCRKASNKFSNVDWYIDSAATIHMTNDKSIYCTKTKPKQGKVQFASGQLLDIKGIDDLLDEMMTDDENFN